MAHEINQACRAAEVACGVRFDIKRNTFAPGLMIDRDRQSYKGKVYFTDFFGNQDDLTISVKVDVTEFDRLTIQPVTRQLIHPYSDSRECAAELHCMALEEIIAGKLKCLIQRRHSHDLFDLVYATFIDRSIALDRRLVLHTFLGKTIFGSSPASAKETLLGIPLTLFGSAWEKFIRCPRASWFGFDRAVEGFRATIEALFEATAPAARGERLFFGPVHRNLIMEAGAGRRLMRLTYHGVERDIEPYALVYKRAAGKQAREYFYAYDQTGGRSPPGIKSFFNTDIDHLEITGELFEPRYEIELAKAGEQIGKGYFGKAFSATMRQRSDSPRQRLTSIGGFKMRTARTAPAYKIQCPYCQKIFSRKTTSLDLNEHKTPDGYKCGGRRGYRVY